MMAAIGTLVRNDSSTTALDNRPMFHGPLQSRWRQADPRLGSSIQGGGRLIRTKEGWVRSWCGRRDSCEKGHMRGENGCMVDGYFIC